MSELNALEASSLQASAMRIFVMRCKRVMLAVAASCCLAIMAAMLTSGVNAQVVPFIGVVWSVMIVYPFVQLIWLRRRTGLWWHSLNAYADWIGLSIVMGLLLYMLLYFLWPLFEARPVYSARIAYVPLVLIIVLPLFRSAFKSSTWTRAKVERVRYGEHWLSLSRLTFWDILLFRIPRERA